MIKAGSYTLISTKKIYEIKVWCAFSMSNLSSVFQKYKKVNEVIRFESMTFSNININK